MLEKSKFWQGNPLPATYKKRFNKMIAKTLLPYIDLNHEDRLPFIDDLSAPLHAGSIIERERKALETEIKLDGFCILLEIKSSPALETALCDFREFMRNCMELDEKHDKAYQFIISLDDSLDAIESFSLDIKKQRCNIYASTVDGIRRALIFLEDEMNIRRSPALPLGKISRNPAVRTRISRSPFATYRFGTGWELDKAEDAYPEEYLNRLAHCGINGIWVAGIYRELIASKVFPEMTVKETRLGLLKQLVEKAALYGIKVYFFCIEPRIQDDRDPVFQKHPEIRGAKWGNYGRTICTSHPLVLKYIEDATAELFRKVPGLGGMINLFRGERTTACCSPTPPVCGRGARPADYVKACPRCSARPMEDIYCDELDAFYKGMSSVSPDAELIAWNYGHKQMELNQKILKKLNPEIRFLDTFEHDGKKEICGKTRTIDEYSISYIGPSAPFKTLQECAKKNQKQLYAKIQLGASFETPSMPYVPVPASPYQKFREMHKNGIQGVMQSWIIGGFPSIMHKAAGEAAFLPMLGEDAFIKRLAAIGWGEKYSMQVTEAWTHFFKAYDLYPFASQVFYFGPITRSPAYHLYLEPQGTEAKPYNWGIQRNRELQPYEDNLKKWCHPIKHPENGFTPDELISSFRTMSQFWEKGLNILRKVAENFSASSVQAKELAVAEAINIQFLSCANVIEFYKLRDCNGSYRRMAELAEDDIRLAQKMEKFIEIDSSIGYQAEMQYYSFSVKLIDEKIKQVKEMLVSLKNKINEQ